jgi:hypothetical protein
VALLAIRWAYDHCITYGGVLLGLLGNVLTNLVIPKLYPVFDKSGLRYVASLSR